MAILPEVGDGSIGVAPWVRPVRSSRIRWQDAPDLARQKVDHPSPANDLSAKNAVRMIATPPTMAEGLQRRGKAREARLGASKFTL